MILLFFKLAYEAVYFIPALSYIYVIRVRALLHFPAPFAGLCPPLQ